MKRITVLLVITLILLLVTGCFGKEEFSSKSNETASAQNNSSLGKIKYADLIPKPEQFFLDGVISIIDQDSGNEYAFRVKNYNDGEYESYVAKCKEMGFSNIHYESENDGGKMFMAYTEDKNYYLEVFLGNEIKAIDVSCKKTTN